MFASMPLAKALWGRTRSSRRSVWSSTDLVSPMSNTSRASEVLLGQGWQTLFISFGLNKQMQKLFFMLQGMKPELWTYRSWLKSWSPCLTYKLLFHVFAACLLCWRKGRAAGIALIRAWHTSLIETIHRTQCAPRVCDVGTQLLWCVRALTDFALAERDLELSQPAEKSGVDSLRQKDKINAQLFQHFPPFASYHKYQYKYRNPEVNSLPSLPFPYACISAVKGFT